MAKDTPLSFGWVGIINSSLTAHCDPMPRTTIKTVGQKPVILNMSLKKNLLGYWAGLALTSIRHPVRFSSTHPIFIKSLFKLR